MTLPKPFRDRLGIRPGTRLEFRLGDDGAMQVKVLATGSASLAGLLARPGEMTRTLADQAVWVSDTVLVDLAWTSSKA